MREGGEGNGREGVRQEKRRDSIPIKGNYVWGGPLSDHESIEEDSGDMGW